MAVKFDLHEKPRTNAAEAVSYIPKLVSAGTVTLKQLCREISSGNSITPGDVKAVVSALCEHMSQHLSDGCTIDLDDLGTFRLSLKSKKPIDYFDDNTAARQLALSRIIFTPKKEFFHRCTPLSYHRVDKPRRKSPVLTDDQILERMAVYMSQVKEQLFTTRDFMHATGIGHTTACKRLKSLVASGRIKRMGHDLHHPYYILATPADGTAQV